MKSSERWHETTCEIPFICSSWRTTRSNGNWPNRCNSKSVKIAGLELSDIGLFELNEAFASQSIQVIRELGLDEEKVNVNGGAIALGHPLGCTGAKLTLSPRNETPQRTIRCNKSE